MNYDKSSFLAGLAVGRKLGWNGGDSPAEDSRKPGIIFDTNLVHGYAGKVLTSANIVFGELIEEA